MTTKTKILEIINKNGATRPFDLVRLLKISPQAMHRHLKVLVSEGIIEPRGKPPSTHYMMTDIPDFKPALGWFKSSKAKKTPSVCETRDVFSARLSHFIPLQKIGFPKEDLPLVISTTGEIGNNSFDHNMGQWKDLPGCWFEIQTTRNRLWVLIADRGQGIYRSISRVVSDTLDEENAVKMVFDEQISGRAPEKRGNGLKYVKSIILDGQGRGIACYSGKGSAYYGDFGKNCLNVLKSVPDQNFGTITLMVWSLK